MQSSLPAMKMVMRTGKAQDSDRAEERRSSLQPKIMSHWHDPLKSAM